jgi:hypothetical protein
LPSKAGIAALLTESKQLFVLGSATIFMDQPANQPKTDAVLAIDLDGSLLRPDLLVESALLLVIDEHDPEQAAPPAGACPVH